MNNAQVPDFENPVETRRRSLSCIHDSALKATCLQDRRLSAPSTRLITRRSSWGPIWELRKQFLPHLRRISSGDYYQQVKLPYSIFITAIEYTLFSIEKSTEEISYVFSKSAKKWGKMIT